MTTRTSRFVLPALLLLPLIGAYGGWASVSVQDLPDYVVAGQPVTLTYTVRQHGHSRLNGLHGRLEARSGRLEASSAATGAGEGRYTATLTVPSAGDWTITIYSGFGNNRVTLLPLRAVAPGAPAPRALAEAERGRQLFVAKGCVTCHLHRDVDGSGVVAVGPELTSRRVPAEYLKAFLANPAIKAPTREGAEMPNLELKPAEIAALSAFINAQRGAMR
jgi:mono/diheme cytochrome c family protein